MPQMGYDMQEGTVVRWMKREGDEVTRGEPIAEIETDKAVVEMEATAAGVLRKILAAEGTVAHVGELIGIIGASDEDISALEAEAPVPAAEAPAAPQAQATPVQTPPPATAPAPSKVVKASPVARRLAQEMGVDLNQVTGSGPGGRIVREDVEALASQGPAAPAAAGAPAPAEAGRLVLTRMRQAIARSTVQSKQQAPHFYVTTEIDMTVAMDFRRQLNLTLKEGGRVSVNDLLIKAAALALVKFPALNSFFRGDHLETHPYISIGIAIDLQQGLIVPAVANCQSKSLVEIALAAKDLAKRAQDGHLHESEYAGGTFSISNLGTLDVDSFSAIIVPPQSAVLAVGSVKKQPVVRDNDQVVVRQIMKATLSVDHRASDGAEGARFLVEVKRFLENPVSLVMG